jgi:hypothetical protein
MPQKSRITNNAKIGVLDDDDGVVIKCHHHEKAIICTKGSHFTMKAKMS